MLFNSFEFLAFFPIVVIATFLIPHRWRWLLLLAASYYFYMAWSPVYILLIIASTIVDYLAGLMLGATTVRRRRIAILCVSMFLNLGLLFFFKYYNFFSHSLESVFRYLSLPLELPESHVLLPIGISFYTFQTMAYTIDVYRGKQEPQKHPGIFALYVTFFPQLVAGPIERAKNLIPQLIEKHEFEYKRVTDGLKLMAWGMFKKIVIADRLASLVDTVYSKPSEFRGPVLVAATFFFAFQIYCDFSGYSDIAIGASQVLGVKLMTNFRRPYFAKSIAEFWQRWHISLSTWFRDYLYISLGGNRVSVPRWTLNIMIVFFLSGLWHGARWTFVIWGVYHGVLLLVEHFSSRLFPAFSKIDNNSTVIRFLKVLLTFILVNIGWIMFRANSVNDLLYITSHLFSGWEAFADITALKIMASHVGMDAIQMLISWVSIMFLVFVQLLQRKGSIRAWINHQHFTIRWALYYALILSLVFFGIFSENQFIYFQF